MSSLIFIYWFNEVEQRACQVQIQKCMKGEWEEHFWKNVTFIYIRIERFFFEKLEFIEWSLQASTRVVFNRKLGSWLKVLKEISKWRPLVFSGTYILVYRSLVFLREIYNIFLSKKLSEIHVIILHSQWGQKVYKDCVVQNVLTLETPSIVSSPFVTTRPFSLRNNLVNRAVDILLKSFAGIKV